MAVSDEREEEPYITDSGSGPNTTFDRQPPQDLSAEQSVLGGMMLSKDAIADVVEVLRPNDFYRPAHQAIYECVLDLYGRGEPADAITVSADLERRQELLKVGGAPYLHTLIATVPTAANAGYYAEIVSEKAVLRRLVEAGTRIVQLGYHGSEGAAIEEVVDRAQASIYDVTERRTSEDYAALEDLLQPTMDEIDAIASRGGESQGLATGFTDLDEVTNGLHAGQMIIVAARPGVGKALALDTPLPTPNGWTTMGEVRIGDRLIGADGRPTEVVAATGTMRDRPCFAVEFADGSALVADANHQWLVGDPGGEQVRTTEQLARHDGGEFLVSATRPVDLPDRELPLPPYVLGAWLGGGCPTTAVIPGADPELVVQLDGAGVHAVPAERDRCELRFPDPETAGTPEAVLDRLGLLDVRHVPTAYARASAAQRRALLAGLLDSCGEVRADGSVRFGPAADRLLADVRELLAGLGHPDDVEPAGDALVFTAGDDVFRLDRLQRLHKERSASAGSPAAAAHWITAVRPVPSEAVRCVQVAADDHLYLAGRSMVPTHNSTLGLDFARAASVKHGMASVIFSLEMGRTEIVMRMLSAEARIRLGDMRGGRMTDDDWTRLARRMSEISEAPVFVDDSPNLTMMEIRAKARRLKQRHDVQLIVVDYMQLMTSGKKVESRQQEVSEFSRQLKLLAKELEVPVVAISQLNRGPEQRTDKKPQLSDLRESGCLTAGTRLLRADTGAEVTFGELMRTGERPLVWSLDERMRMVPRAISNVFSSGVKEVFRVRLTSGREIEATANHPMLTLDGWRPAGELGPGSRVAVPGKAPEPLDVQERPESELVLLAHLIGDGSFVRRQPLRYASADEANLTAVTEAAEHFGVEVVRDDYPEARATTLRLRSPVPVSRSRRNPIAEWLDDMGLFGLRSHEKYLPDRVFSLPRAQVAIFLHHLWATDGSVRWDDSAQQGRVYYATTSRRLADDVSRLLLRFGVLARIKSVRKGSYRTGYHVEIYGAENQLRFLDEIGVHGGRSLQAAALAEQLRGKVGNTNCDTVPKEVWNQVRGLLSSRSMTHRDFSSRMGTQFCGSAMWKTAPSRTRLARAAAVLEDTDLEVLATNDVFWDEIAEVTSLGEQPVYDATVPGTHNFIADGIAMHNSLEQDADMVILIHRPDAFERDDPRMGEADLILAKHRAGPTSTVTVAHQLHYSRFVDMAPE